jgi:Domain of unknown function (DUF4760)
LWYGCFIRDYVGEADVIRPVLVRSVWFLIGLVLGACFGVWLAGLEISTWEQAGKIAPVWTAVVATVAATIAVAALLVQRDIAKRRAAIDFFLKTEMDTNIIDAYEKFLILAPTSPQLVEKPSFDHTHTEYKALRRWLNICELIAVGVNKDAFSNRVSKDYWGDVLLKSYRDAEPFVKFVRQTEGTPETLVDLEKLAKKWK